MSSKPCVAKEPWRSTQSGGFSPPIARGTPFTFSTQRVERRSHSLSFLANLGRTELCLADYANPRGEGAPDNVCLFAVTAGKGIRGLYQRYKEEGEYLKSHAIQALALETAEACAEWLHSKIRGWWGFPDNPQMTMRERFQARYRGRRYSFGYPACPDLALQKTLFELLRPEEIGIELTDELMMDPEASVSALVFHHPACEYFAVGKEGM